MADFDAEMRSVADDLLGKFLQGEVSLKRLTTTSGANEWDPPTETVEAYPLKAARQARRSALRERRADRRHGRYRDLCRAQGRSGHLTDMLVIDGKDRVITSLKPTPSAGTMVAWKAVCAV